MTNRIHLPHLPVVDLGGSYLSHLEQIDVENQSRHYCGEPLLEYPTFEEFVSDCRDASFAAEPKVCAHVHDHMGFTKVPELDHDEETEIKWLLPVPHLGAAIEDEECMRLSEPDDTLWVSEFGTFAFRSTAQH